MMGVVPGSGGADEEKKAFKHGQVQPHHRLIQTSFKIELNKRILIDPPLPLLQRLMSTDPFFIVKNFLWQYSCSRYAHTLS